MEEEPDFSLAFMGPLGRSEGAAFKKKNCGEMDNNHHFNHLAYNSMAFSTFTMLYNDCHYLVPRHVHYPKGRPYTHSIMTPHHPLPTSPHNHSSASCLCWFASDRCFIGTEYVNKWPLVLVVWGSRCFNPTLRVTELWAVKGGWVVSAMILEFLPRPEVYVAGALT